MALALGPDFYTEETPCCQIGYRSNMERIEMSEDKRLYVHAPCNLNLCMGYNFKEFKKMTFDFHRSVVHCGNNSKGPRLGILNTAKHINAANVPPRHYVYIENAAGQGCDLGHTWEEFRRLYEALDRSVVRVCIDTQHSFASGLCDFRSRTAIRKLFQTAEDEIGGIQLIHLNDSKTEYLSRKDRHENIGQGYIWSVKPQSLRTLLRHSQDHNTDLILETPDSSGDLEVVNKIFRSL